MKTRLLRFVAPALLWFGRVFLGWARLDSLDAVELGVPVEDVIARFGPPDESRPSEDVPGGTFHTFTIGPFHQIDLTVLDGKVVQLTYWSAHAAPTRDLRWMLDTYGEDIGWDEVERGYWYWRKDGRVRLWCSVAPAIGVGTKEYFAARQAEAQRKKAAR